MKVYLSGAMSNQPDGGEAAFTEAAAYLRAEGHEVISPLEMDVDRGLEEVNPRNVPEKLWQECLADDLRVICDPTVEAIVVLPGWQDSRGAALEVYVAQQLGKPILAYPSLEPVEQRITSKTGGAKGRKLQRFELLPWGALGEVAELYAAGATKYDDHNWRKGYPWSLSFGAMMRHAALWQEGEDVDSETGCHHMASVVFHALGLMHFRHHYPEGDDRPNALRET